MSAERARRRREAREHTTVVVRDTGFQQEARPSQKLAPKQPGQHRWIATALYSITEPEVRSAYDPAVEKHMDNENLVDVSFGCIDCEKPLGMIQPGSVCLAPAYDGWD